MLQDGGRPWEGASRAAGRRICPGPPRVGARRMPRGDPRHSTLEAAQTLGLARIPCRRLAAAALLMDLHRWQILSGISSCEYPRAT